MIYQITKRSKTDANWVLAHTTSAGVSRGYGASIPTTEVYLLKSGSPEPCTVAKSGAPQCQAEKNFQVCEQLDCMAGGVLSAAAWIQPLPITVTRTNGFEVVGSTTVSAFDWVTKFTEVGPEQLEVRWNGAFDIVLDTGLSAADTLIGIAMLSGAGTTSGSVDHEIKLSSPGKVEVHFDLASPELGSVVHEGTIIGNIAGFQINWLDPCSNI